VDRNQNKASLNFSLLPFLPRAGGRTVSLVAAEVLLDALGIDVVYLGMSKICKEMPCLRSEARLYGTGLDAQAQ
jgi:hypothetical protein